MSMKQNKNIIATISYEALISADWIENDSLINQADLFTMQC